MAEQPESLPELFNKIKGNFPSSMAQESWYLIPVSISSRNMLDPSNLGQLYKYLTSEPEHKSPEQRRALNKRLREFVMKQWVTVGAPKAAVALFGLIKEEKPGDADLSFTKYDISSILTNSSFRILRSIGRVDSEA